MQLPQVQMPNLFPRRIAVGLGVVIAVFLLWPFYSVPTGSRGVVTPIGIEHATPSSADAEPFSTPYCCWPRRSDRGVSFMAVLFGPNRKSRGRYSDRNRTCNSLKCRCRTFFHAVLLLA